MTRRWGAKSNQAMRHYINTNISFLHLFKMIRPPLVRSSVYLYLFRLNKYNFWKITFSFFASFWRFCCWRQSRGPSGCAVLYLIKFIKLQVLGMRLLTKHNLQYINLAFVISIYMQRRSGVNNEQNRCSFMTFIWIMMRPYYICKHFYAPSASLSCLRMAIRLFFSGKLPACGPFILFLMGVYCWVTFTVKKKGK